MEPEDRDKIQKCYSSLVQFCNVDTLLPVLIEKKVFSPEMSLKYFNMPDPLTRKRRLFLDVPLRGPQAFSALVAALRETNQHQLANHLEPSNNGHVPVKKSAKPFLLPLSENTEDIRQIAQNASSGSVINLKTQPSIIHVKAANKFFDQDQTHLPVYSTHSKNRGMVLIINVINYENDLHKPRSGAEIDGRNLQELFTQMGLKVDMYVDLTSAQIKEAILKFKSSHEISKVDMVFVIIMAHGDQNQDITYILGSDNVYINTKLIEEQFDNANCKPLQKRPKIIMYQTCRGKQPDYGVSERIQTDSASQRTLRTREDMLIAHSTLPGDVSHRDVHLGTWYIQTFCEIMMKHACDHHIEEVFKLVDSRLAQLNSPNRTMQTSMFSNVGFNKHCYVHPNIYLDNGVIKYINDDSIVI